jgi:MoaA/NifB/PqqE/SkfB family radical SAM enzyme
MERIMKITSAYLEITNRCNFNCSTCYNRSGLNKETVEMNIENIKSAISLFCSLGATGFSVAGGEPLLHSRIEELLDLTEQYKNKSFDFVTNGSIHNERFIELYIKQKNINIQVSLDGSCEEINSRTRGKDHFSRTVDFIKKLNCTEPLSSDAVYMLLDEMTKRIVECSDISTKTKNAFKESETRNIIDNTLTLIGFLDKASSIITDIDERIFIERIFHQVMVNYIQKKK